MEKLEPADSLLANVFTWYKSYLAHKITTLKSPSNLKIDIHVKKILFAENIEELDAIAKFLAAQGMTSFYNYAKPLFRFYTFLESIDIGSMKEITSKILYKKFALEYCKKINLADSTSEAALRIIINFFNYIDENNSEYKYKISKDSQGVAISSPFTNQNDFEYITEEELKTFNNYLDEIEPTKDTLNHYRDILLLKFLYTTGISSSELINLKKSDIKEKKDLFELKIKGNHARSVCIPQEKVSKCFDKYKAKDNKETSIYFFTTNGEQLKPTTIQSITKKYFLASPVKKENITPSMIRNSYAILLDKYRIPNTEIQKLLGFKDKATLSKLLAKSKLVITPIDVIKMI